MPFFAFNQVGKPSASFRGIHGVLLTNDQAKSHRNSAYAEQAYATAIHFLNCNLEAGQNLEIEAKLTQLNSLRAGCPSNGLFKSLWLKLP